MIRGQKNAHNCVNLPTKSENKRYIFWQYFGLFSEPINGTIVNNYKHLSAK